MLDALFTTLLVIGIAVAVLFLLACLIVMGIMLVLIFTTPKAEEEDRPVRLRTSDVEPPHDEALFRRLAAEAMAYATRPFHTTVTDVVGVFLCITVSDPFGLKVYAESRRRVGKTLAAVLCVYGKGGSTPSAAARIEIPASHVDWAAHFAAIKDIQADGPKLSFTDHRGARREVRIPKGGRHHA